MRIKYFLNSGETHPCHRAGNRTPSQEGNLNISAIKNIVIISLCILAMQSCKPDNLKEGAEKEYFDIKGYFQNSVLKLSKQHNKINKTVVHNGIAESKDVEIKNWKTELALFAESDINKPAWKGSYTKRDSARATTYSANQPDLKTRRIVISKTPQGDVKQIAIYNEVNNALYNTRETLNYYPDSLYIINKYQKVKLLGANTYTLTGRF
jgi:hypothetical protein